MKTIPMICLNILLAVAVQAEDSINTTRTILLKNSTPYLFALEDRSTNEKWSVESNDYRKITLDTHLPTSISPVPSDEEDNNTSGGEIPFPHTLSISYQHDGQLDYITDCVDHFPETDSIIQVFMGHSGVHCVMSDYRPH